MSFTIAMIASFAGALLAIASGPVEERGFRNASDQMLNLGWGLIIAAAGLLALGLLKPET